jgi:glycosyltransferase involved in cell wall biosynthesis
MKVAYFSDTLPPHTDGVVNTLCRLIDTLTNEKIDFQFFSPFKPGVKIRWRDKVKKISYIPFLLYKDYRLGFPFFDGLAKKLDAFQPDLIHVVSPTLLGIYGLKYALRNHIKAVASYHTNFVDYLPYYGLSKMKGMGWRYLRWFYNQFAKIYVPSRATIKELQNHGITRTELWQRGIDLERFSPAHRSRELRLSLGVKKKPVLLFVGRLVKEKDLDDLVEAHTLLRKKYDYKLVLVGDGPMREELEDRLPETYFAGQQSGENLSKWYASADIFVFPSTTETFGNVILEAFASGLAVVCVNKGGCADLVIHGRNGWIAEANAPGDFALRIGSLIKHRLKRRRFSRAAVRTVRNYSWCEINQGLLRSYRQVLSQ